MGSPRGVGEWGDYGGGFLRLGVPGFVTGRYWKSFQGKVSRYGDLIFSSKYSNVLSAFSQFLSLSIKFHNCLILLRNNQIPVTG